MFEGYQEVWDLANNRMITKIMKKMFYILVQRIKTIKMLFPVTASKPSNQSNKTSVVRPTDILTGMKLAVSLVL